MDDVVLVQKIREVVRDEACASALVKLVSLRNAMRELSDLVVLVGVISGSPLKKADLKDLESIVATVKDEELKKELGYLLNLAEDIISGKLFGDLFSLSEMQERMHFIGYLLAIVVVLTALVYRFSADDIKIKLIVLALAFISLLVSGNAFLRTFLSKRKILKRFALRYKLK